MAVVVFLAKVIGLVVVLYHLLKFILKRYQLQKDLEWVPGPHGLPILGNLLDIIGKDQPEILKLMARWNATYGPVFKIWVGMDPVIVVQDADLMQVLSNTGKEALKSIEYKFLENYVGKSLLNTSGDIWYHKRKLMTPCFHYEILNGFLDSMNGHARKLISHISSYADNNRPFNFLTLAKLTTLDILMDTSMGLNINALENNNSNPYVRACNKMCEILMKRSLSPVHRSNFLFKFTSAKKIEDEAAETLRSFVQETVRAKREMRKNEVQSDKNPTKGKKRKALLDMLLDLTEGGTPITDKEIENEVNTFVFAGHDTTSSAISFAIHALGTHPEIQERIFEELNELVPDLIQTGLTQADLHKLEFMERFIKESMRMFPPVPLIGKRFKDRFDTGKGFIPKYVNITENIYNLHHDGRHYPEPHVFDPDRFLPDNINSRPTYSYIPFSSGARNCIGQKFALNEVKTVVAYIVKKYKIESMLSTEDLRIGFDIVLTPYNGINIKIQHR